MGAGVLLVDLAGVAIGFQRQILVDSVQLFLELALGVQIVEHDIRAASLALQGGEIRHPGGIDADGIQLGTGRVKS